MSTYTPIATQTLGSAASTVNFSSIPQNYTDLVLVINAYSNSSSTDYGLRMRINGDSGSNYSLTALRGSGSSASSYRASNQTQCYLANDINNSSSVTTNFTKFTVNIMNYSNTSKHKTILNRSDHPTIDMGIFTNLWRSTDAISSLSFYCNTGSIGAGSTFTIYGIAAGQVATKAIGGIITTSGSYTYHTFLSSGSFIPQEPLTADILVVGGGGGGGGYAGGGGGAGGLLYYSSQSLLTQSYGCVVGAGGIGLSGQSTSGTQSIFTGLNPALGGGNGAIGGGGTGIYASNGGSGGGASTYYPPGLGTAGQGNNGGALGTTFSSGGGGAGAAGAAGTNTAGGNGGIGVNTYSTFASATSTGASGYYAGGGGGGVDSRYPSNYGLGGSGGGGNGGVNNTSTGANMTNPISGTTNTGGGGGGGGGSGATGGNGGSGIIIVRYLS